MSSKPPVTLTELAAGIDRPGETDMALVLVLHDEYREFAGLPISAWLSQASDSDLVSAWEVLARWDIPSDVDEDEQPATADDYIAWHVEQAEAAADFANDLARAYNDGRPEDEHIPVMDYPETAIVAAEAVLRIEQHDKARNRALALLRAEVGRRASA